MIEPLPRVMRDYLAGFNLGCILVSSTGEIQVVGSNHLARMSSVAACGGRKIAPPKFV
jgi:hypothetical protein